MVLIDGTFLYSATDLNEYLECRHLTELERLRALGAAPTRPEQRESVALIARKGDEHERRYLEILRERKSGVVVFEPFVATSVAQCEDAERRTIAAMEEGAPIIYQAAFFDGRFWGRADFLRRVDVPCERLPWSYEVIDTKLALNPKPYFIIQLCHYSEHLARIQGTQPARGHIVLGSGDERHFQLSDYLAYYRHLKESFLEYLAQDDTSYPYECEHCSICAWAPVCEKRRDDDDHLSLVAGIRRDQIKRLEDAGIGTLAQLAAAPETQKPRGMIQASFDNLRMQAGQQHLQREARRNGEASQHYYKFRPVAPELSGFAKLPEPARGDIFFDIEGDPLYRADRGLEYLWGFYLPDEDEYRSFWATDPSQELSAFERFVDFVVDRRKRYPDLHVYHYASYETAALKRLMGRFGSRENEIDQFLRTDLFVDLYPIVRQSVWLSQSSYGIKKVEAFYDWQRSTQTRGGDESIVMFESWRESGDQTILDDLRAYNEDDCRSTFQLREWLLARRDELNATLSEPIPWRSPPEPEEEDRDQVSDAERALLSELPAPESLAELRAYGEDLRGCWLLGQILRYHRREQRPEWWEYFNRCDNVADLEEYDSRAIGGLRLCDEIKPYTIGRDKNAVYTYRFPPQEYDLGGGKPVCPDTGKAAGSIVNIDDAAGTLQIKLSGVLDPQKLRALIPGKPIPDHKKRTAMETIADLYLAGTLEQRHPALIEMLLVCNPRLRGIAGSIQPDLVDRDSVSERVRRLDRSYLFVQGPPGTAKSTIAAACIVDLIADGKRVGVMANSHKAIHNLLKKIEANADERGVRFSGVHKSSESTAGSTYESCMPDPMIVSSSSIAALAADECVLASGTPYAWAEDILRERFDYLFIDEAGQIALADALVAATAARNVVLFGDPLQLPQVTKGSHPLGAGLSILEHLLNGAATVPQERGIFLDISYRLQPEICDFVSRNIYEGRLRSDPRCSRNGVNKDNGLLYIPVEHEGNSRYSIEEAHRVVSEVQRFLSGTVTVGDAPARPMTADDILVVTPYNLQRIKIQQLLEKAGWEGVRVGTVDKFQGQQAPVVLYSLATSSADTMPRGMEFLFDRNRFNVAISRAQCLSVLICSPRLLDARCSKPEQLTLVNLLCAFVESASTTEQALV